MLNRNADLIADDLQLIDSGWTLQVRRDKERLLAGLLDHHRKTPRRCLMLRTPAEVSRMMLTPPFCRCSE